MIADDKIIHIEHDVEIRRVEKPANAAQVNNQQAVVQNVGCDKIILKTSYYGPQGPKGDTATFNDLEIPSLTARFELGL